MDKVIISMTTIPGRLAYFRRAFDSILSQKDISRVDRIVVNLQDLPDNNIDDYSLVMKPERPLPVDVEIVVRPWKWGSANKLLWVYADHPDAAVVTVDDDIVYPPTCLGELLEASERNPGCIVSQESNPVIIGGDGRISFVNAIEYAFGMRGFSKYLTNACLFPPKSLGPVSGLLDYDGFMTLTDGRHDELWFWVHSVLNGVRSVVLPNTYSFELDHASLPTDEFALNRINSVPGNIAEYNRRVNEIYGKRLSDVFGKQRIEIPVDLRNYGTVMLGVNEIYGTYGMFGLDLVLSDELRLSHAELLLRLYSRHNWPRGVRVVVADRLRGEIARIRAANCGKKNDDAPSDVPAKEAPPAPEASDSREDHPAGKTVKGVKAAKSGKSGGKPGRSGK